MPTRDTAWPAGTPCWIDYNAVDVEAAKAFYTDLLGWSYTEGEPEYGGYLTCLGGGRAAAGMMPRMTSADAPAWTTYFATADADASAAAVTEAGGTVLYPPMDVGDMGRMAVAQDPEGNGFSLWQAGQHPGVSVYNEPGGLVWNEAAVRDQAAARDFYRQVFGFTFDDMGDDYATFGLGGDPLGGLGAVAEGQAPGWNTCFSVADTDDAVAVTEKNGGTVTRAAEDTPYGRLAALADPWGATFAVMQISPG